MRHSMTRRLPGAVLATVLLAWAPMACGGGRDTQQEQDDRAEERNAIDPSSPERSPQREAQGGSAAGQVTMTAQGELTSVDANARTMTVRTSTGSMTFRYDDETAITGSQTGAAGLATMSGSQVTVHYRRDGASNVATRVDMGQGAGTHSN